MDPRSETSAVIDIVRGIAPWVWPATAAILVGGLVVVSSLIGATRQSASSKPAAAFEHAVTVDRLTIDSEIRNDARAN
jgi:hypothetical protein